MKDSSKLDEKYVAYGSKVYTRRDLITAVKNETKFGLEQIDLLLKLTIDLLERKRIKYNPELWNIAIYPENDKSNWLYNVSHYDSANDCWNEISEYDKTVRHTKEEATDAADECMKRYIENNKIYSTFQY